MGNLRSTSVWSGRWIDYNFCDMQQMRRDKLRRDISFALLTLPLRTLERIAAIIEGEEEA